MSKCSIAMTERRKVTVDQQGLSRLLEFFAKRHPDPWPDEVVRVYIDMRVLTLHPGVDERTISNVVGTQHGLAAKWGWGRGRVRKMLASYGLASDPEARLPTSKWWLLNLRLNNAQQL